MRTNIIKQRILQGRFDAKFLELYLDPSLLDYQKKRYVKAIEEFEKLYGEQDAIVLSVPGRSEVAGNHTDHQHGRVLCCSINLDIIAIAAKAKDIAMVSDERKMFIPINRLECDEKQKRSSKNLIRGVLTGLDKLYYRIGGFNAYCTSDVLVGSGMSSSAAFEVMIGNIISHLYNRGQIDPIEIAKVSQYAENVFFGKPSGLMDQMACSVGGLITIDFKDEKNPIVKKIEVDFSQFHHSLCIVDTKGSHSNLTDEYASIPIEMKKVAHFFQKEYIREVHYEEIISQIDLLRKEVGDRAVLRSLHVILENERVLQDVQALENQDFASFLQGIKASGDSSFKYLQNIYANSDVQAQGIALALMISEQVLQGKGACRVHGGGFAGSIQAFVSDDMVEEYRQKMDQVFGEGSCKVLKATRYGGHLIVM